MIIYRYFEYSSIGRCSFNDVRSTLGLEALDYPGKALDDPLEEGLIDGNRHGWFICNNSQLDLA